MRPVRCSAQGRRAEQQARLVIENRLTSPKSDRLLEQGDSKAFHEADFTDFVLKRGFIGNGEAGEDMFTLRSPDAEGKEDSIGHVAAGGRGDLDVLVAGVQCGLDKAEFPGVVEAFGFGGFIPPGAPADLLRAQDRAAFEAPDEFPVFTFRQCIRGGVGGEGGKGGSGIFEALNVPVRSGEAGFASGGGEAGDSLRMFGGSPGRSRESGGQGREAFDADAGQSVAPGAFFMGVEYP